MNARKENGGHPPNVPLSRVALRSLAAVASDDANAQLQWPSSDLPDLWRHQIRASIVKELAAIDGVAALQASEVTLSHPAPVPSTFEALIRHEQPHRDLLRVAEQVALQRMSDPEPVTPPDVTCALHIVLMLVERLRCGRVPAEGPNSPEMSDAELRRRAEWMLRQAWIDQASKDIATEAMSELRDSDYPIR